MPLKDTKGTKILTTDSEPEGRHELARISEQEPKVDVPREETETAQERRKGWQEETGGAGASGKIVMEVNESLNGLAAREPSLVRLYAELTGASESAARGVFMYLCERQREDSVPGGGDGAEAVGLAEPAPEPCVWSAGQAGRWLSWPLPVPAAG